MSRAAHRVVLCVVASLALGRSASAAEHIALAGTELSGLGSYTYAGVISPLGSARLGDGLVMRHWLERLTYEYDSNGTGIDAERYGYAPALGYQGRLGGGYASGYAGVRIAHTDLSPEDPGNDEDGGTVRGFLQVDAGTPLGEIAENQFVGGFELRYSDYYVRERLLFRTGSALRVGPEVVFKGGHGYDGWQAGIALGGLRLFERVDLVLRGGVSGQRDESNTAYGSLELVMSMGAPR